MEAQNTRPLNRRPLIIAGILLGIGQGGFFDGIVFHQILQWHHMFTNIETSQTVNGFELNTIGDGFFHAFDWLMTIAGIVTLWLAVKRDDVPKSTPIFIGSFTIGAGLFNLVEGIINHHILQIHHVRPGAHQLAWDLSFLGIGLLAIAIGWVILLRTKVSAPVTK
ncbi:DUF2243 domain-containing protein [Mastigocoleus testarum]|uniref:DUF2243 domain-containing protein n=1 Tax=Mastigocoleus testarum BC008 TaxID=371196 RepID=A0A0V7ZQS3_9CYAN|nr:DUF2243 domain-containing protein [Mastigocoleus testarum]KST64911.1 hypothetical protein BC008_19065 [Mastigocoleus testarum BC008]KST67008.1 hypothetical protein BC008_27845 [Mastigocoleus testarum BC008]